MNDKKQVNFTVVPDDAPEMPRIYSNFCGIQHSPFDFTLTFCEMPPIGERQILEAQESNVVRAPVRSRLVVPVQLIPGLVAALQENYRIYQESFGPMGGPTEPVH